MKFFVSNKNIWACLALGFIFLACNENDRLDIERSAAAFDIKQGEASVKLSNKNFMKAFKSRDSVGISNCYATDAKTMFSNTPSIEGREEIKNYFSQVLKNKMKEVELNTIKIWGDSTILTEEGVYEFIDSSGESYDKGNYIALWKVEAGNWKIFREIWASENRPEALPEKKSVPKK